MLVYLGGMVPAMFVSRRQWAAKQGAGGRALIWALAWPVWVLFWMAEEVFGDDR